MSRLSTYRFWITGVLRKASIFLFLLLLFLLLQFYLGNLQNFLDSTQLKLLTMVEITGLLFIIISVYYFVFLIISAVVEKRVRIFALLSSVLGAGVGIGVYFGVQFLISWFQLSH